MIALVDLTPLHERLLEAAGKRSYREIAALTDIHPETVRRYMQGQAPSAEFLEAACTRLGLNGDWLLTGRGPMKASDVSGAALKAAKAGDLLSALAGTVESLVDRVDRMQLFVQTLETRVRAGAAAAAASSRSTDGSHLSAGLQRADAALADAKTAAVHVGKRAQLLRDALAQRPRPDAGGTPPPRGP